MRTYLYISETKLSGLLGQVPTKLREKLSGEIAFNVGVLSGKIVSQLPGLELSSGQVPVVESHLRDQGLVGDLNSDKPWIYCSSDFSSVSLPNCEDVFVLASMGSEPSQLVVLAGSAANLVSSFPAAKQGYGYSFLPRLVETFRSAVGADTVVAAQHSEVEQAINHVLQLPWGPRLGVSFLARRLFRSNSSHRSAQLLSPLYVVQRDDA